MTTPERRNADDDYSYFILGALLTLIGLTSFTTRVVEMQQRLFTALCLVAGVAILATAPKYMWRFRSLCISIMAFGGVWTILGLFTFVTGESGGMASHHVDRMSGIYQMIAGAAIGLVGFVLRTVYSAFHK